MIGAAVTAHQAKGAIMRVIPPVKTNAGGLIQIVTNIKNIGKSPGKFYTKVSIPGTDIAAIQSNSVLLEPGQQGVVYQTLQMPPIIPTSSLLQVKSDLYRQNASNPSATPIYDDTNYAQLPHPSTTLGMPPPLPPMPNYPMQQFPAPYPYRAFSSRGHDKHIEKKFKHLSKHHPDHPDNIHPSHPRHPFHPDHPYKQHIKPMIAVIPLLSWYPPGMPITIATVGFIPGEPVTIQIYVVVDIAGMSRFKQKIGMRRTVATMDGTTYPLQIPVPPILGRQIAIVAIGNMSGKRVHKKIRIG
jgi:hypothetical protein